MSDLFSLAAVFIMIFFLGMRILRIGLYQISYKKMKYFIGNHTNSTVTSVFIGLLATALLQSSSVTLVLTISLVGLGLLTFKQSLGIMLGANIGTTITGEIMTISHAFPVWIIVVVGSILMLINHRFIFSVGAIIFGLGTIFVALNGFETLTELIEQIPILTEGLVYTNQYPSIGIIVGTIISGIIQSSSATIGITMSFLNEELIGLGPSIAIVLGANIGTCFTAILAAMGLNGNSKLVAMAHVWFNILGVLAFLPFIPFLTEIASYLSTDPKEQLAHISVLFNLVTVLCMLPFLQKFEQFILRIHSKHVAK